MYVHDLFVTSVSSFVTVPPALDRFALIIDGLCRAVAARHRFGLAGPLIVLIWGRLRRLATRFAASAARGPATAAPVRRATERRPASSAPEMRLPVGFAWLLRLVPEAAGHASQWQFLLSDPEMVALLEQVPRLHRMVRPLCRMLGVAAPRLVAKTMRRRPLPEGCAPEAPRPAVSAAGRGEASVQARAPCAPAAGNKRRRGGTSRLTRARAFP